MDTKASKKTIFISDLDCGGAQRVVLTLSAELVRQGYPVDLVVARSGGVLESEVPSGVCLVNLCDIKTNKLVFPFKVLFRLIKYLRRVQPHSVLSSVTGANLVVVLARWFVSRQFVLVLRHENAGLNLNGKMLNWCMARMYPRADAVITISPGAASDLVGSVKLPSEKVHVIGNPVNITEVRRKAAVLPNHPWINEPNIPVLVGVGRFYPEKDFENLIKAFALLRQEREARLVILGDGPGRNKLEALVEQFDIEESVYLPGVVQNPYPWMSFANMFVLSSRSEGLPVALIEAMALGCKIVATDCHSGPRDLLAGGKYGILVPVADEKALSVACLRFDREHSCCECIFRQ